jgi:DNA repair protein RecN (Recombination protein N)
MLKHLYIKDFILIKELDLDFFNGFSAFTGETGAGKSILIDAIGYLSGERANTSIIRKGCSKTVLEGLFYIGESYECKKLLESVEIDVEDEIIITRIISNDSKSSIKLNHRSITLNLLKEVFSLLLDIHSQHNTQYLLKKSYHIELLDTYCNKQELIKDVDFAYKQYNVLNKEYNEALLNTYNENDLEYLQYQVEEIEKASLIIGEDYQLEVEEKEIKNFEKTYTSINQTIEILNNDEGVNNNLYQIVDLLNSSDSDSIKSLNERINNAYQDLIDVNDELNNYINTFDFDENTINKIQNRLFEINKLKRKYGNSIEFILEKHNDLLEKIDKINNKEQYLMDMTKKIDKAFLTYQFHAEKLTKLRKEYAKDLEKEILIQLKDLELNNAQFKVLIDKNDASRKGNDSVEFLISMNKGSNLQSLNKVASGGELSRLMLGLKVIFTRLTNIDTIIFDEIDSGVSGKVATSIGLKMATLGKEVQVFSVTHLSQVASCANMHYHIDKTEDDDISSSVCNLLNNDERINKLASISYGKITESSLKSSKELFEDNQQKVSKL